MDHRELVLVISEHCGLQVVCLVHQRMMPLQAVCFNPCEWAVL